MDDEEGYPHDSGNLHMYIVVQSNNFFAIRQSGSVQDHSTDLSVSVSWRISDFSSSGCATPINEQVQHTTSTHVSMITSNLNQSDLANGCPVATWISRGRLEMAKNFNSINHRKKNIKCGQHNAS